MKKLVFVLLLLIVPAIASAECQQFYDEFGNGIHTVTFVCEGNATGAISDTNTTDSITSSIKGKYLYKVYTADLGTTATANSDVYIKDRWGIDLLNGDGENKLNPSSGEPAAIPNTSGANMLQPIVSYLTLDVDNQAVAGSTYEVVLVIVE